MSLNKVLLIGNLGADPESRQTANAQMVCNFNIATTRRWNRDGEWQEETEWHRIVVWGRQAETCQEYLHKGSQVFVEGRLQTRQWEDKDGNKRYTTEIIAQNVQFLGRKGEASSGGGSGSGFSERSSAPSFGGGENNDSNDDDIPF